MIIRGNNPETGAAFQAEVNTVNTGFIESMKDFDMTDEGIKKIINNLNVSADVKSLLYSFSKATIQVGEYIIKVGRKIIDFICAIYREYPNVTFGLIFGAIAGFLVSSIAVIGVVLGPIFAPIAIAFGLISGFSQDIKNKDLDRRIREINASFSPLKAE